MNTKEKLISLQKELTELKEDLSKNYCISLFTEENMYLDNDTYNKNLEIIETRDNIKQNIKLLELEIQNLTNSLIKD